jgi:hypothetical protein
MQRITFYTHNKIWLAYSIGVQTFYRKGPHPYCGGGSRTTRGKITIIGIATRLNYCVIYITNVAAGRGLGTNVL